MEKISTISMPPTVSHNNNFSLNASWKWLLVKGSAHCCKGKNLAKKREIFFPYILPFICVNTSGFYLTIKFQLAMRTSRTGNRALMSRICIHLYRRKKIFSLPPIAMEKFTPMCREGNNEPKYIISWSSFSQPWSEFTWKFYCNSAIHFCWWQASIGLSQNGNHHRFLRREFRWTSGVCHNLWTAFFSCLIIVDHSEDFYRNI